MKIGASASQRPNSPAKPNSSAAVCAAASARACVTTGPSPAHPRLLLIGGRLSSARANACAAPPRESFMPLSTPAAKAIAAVRHAPGTRVKVAVSDIDGVLRGKYIHKDKFYSAAEGGF